MSAPTAPLAALPATLWLAHAATAPAPDEVQSAAAVFSPSEQARLARITRPARRAQFIAGHLLLRALLQSLAPAGAGRGRARRRCEPGAQRRLGGRAGRRRGRARRRHRVVARCARRSAVAGRAPAAADVGRRTRSLGGRRGARQVVAAPRFLLGISMGVRGGRRARRRRGRAACCSGDVEHSPHCSPRQPAGRFLQSARTRPGLAPGDVLTRDGSRDVGGVLA